MKIVPFIVLQFILVSALTADYRTYEAEKREAFQNDASGGAYIAPGWGGGVELAPDQPNPDYDSTVDEDMLFDSYHNQ